MPDDVDKDVYPEPPQRTPVSRNRSGLPDPTTIFLNLFYYTVDKPVTAFHDWIERQRAGRKVHYYHRIFQRVPDISQCLEDDALCMYEANMQWKRDVKVDQEIVGIMRERLIACRTREGDSADQNCAGVFEQYTKVCAAYRSRYGDLGANGNARKCLMKQKNRMIEERKAAAASTNEA
ncbi:NADH dehydrogenase [ubiquinone] 1 beta subcomplex subunit 10 [Hyperolius riggenbachi]|uniref:NADH dehydrogenase [ubiquinone] 1 beta subcomplex subunit 10 n=1 Tax=Hyperolius riggenbachi TaxID=752182 RepID=UPI0035A313AC